MELRIQPQSRLLQSCSRAVIAGAAFAAASLAGPALAQDSEPTRDDEILVIGKNYVDTNPVSKDKAPLIEVPQSISVISRDRIDLLGWTKTEQTVRYISGVVGEGFGPDERGSSLRIRAFTPDQFVDGVLSPVGALRNTNIDLYLMERVEILKGPNSAFYGQVPPGGIYNLTTRRPQSEFSAELRGTVGSYELKQGSADITGPLNASKTLMFRMTGTAYDKQHQVDGAFAYRWAGLASLAFEPDADTSILLTGLYQRDGSCCTLQFLPYFGTQAPNPNGVIPRERASGQPDFAGNFLRQFDVGYLFDHKFSNLLSVSQTVKYGEYVFDAVSVFASSMAANLRTVNRTGSASKSTTARWTVDTRTNWTFGTGPLSHELTLGFDFYSAYIPSVSGTNTAAAIDIFAPVYPANSSIVIPTLTSRTLQKQTQFGWYGQDRIKVGDFVLTAGARHDTVDGFTRNLINNVRTRQHNEAWSYRVGANYVTSIGLAPYVGYSRSFSPIFGTDFFGTPFQPQTSTQIEAGLKYDVKGMGGDSRIFLSAAAFEYNIDNVLTNDPDPTHTGFQVQSGKSRMRGIELEGSGRLANGLTFNLAFTWADPIVTATNAPNTVLTPPGQPALPGIPILGKRLPAIPETQASAFIDYTFPDGPFEGFGIGAGARYTSNKYGDAANYFMVPAVTIFDAVAHYRVDDWSFYLNANNVFDKNYIAICTSFIGCSYGAARVITFSVAKKFR
ncbi:TonB-dependent siderophore receptor [Sphingomonas sp. MG17]|uniref:TonB-dependent siderophore receptor n=1 Tax=Sphingomonas tagetis TaxID=2949092 RepID=A0A9X2HH56_9SPHN|nr:TonB-dependent siderophore receptor [Sphingomonas tagetis]MCP3729842.1 TonB-dependent siderophore receptor [Sphingomonas tagetis]